MFDPHDKCVLRKTSAQERFDALSSPLPENCMPFHSVVGEAMFVAFPKAMYALVG